MMITTVEWVLSKCIFSTYNEKERIYYSCPRIIDNLLKKGEIKVNGNIIKSICHNVYEGDIVYYNGKEYRFEKNDLFCAWIIKYI